MSRFHSGLPYGSHQTTAEDNQHSVQAREGRLSLPSPERLCVLSHQQDGRTILRNPLIPETKLVPSRVRSHRTSPLRPVSASCCQRAKENKLDPPFTQRVDFERLWREAELPFKLGISSPVNVPNCDTVFEAVSQRSVV